MPYISFNEKNLLNKRYRDDSKRDKQDLDEIRRRFEANKRKYLKEYTVNGAKRNWKVKKLTPEVKPEVKVIRGKRNWKVKTAKAKGKIKGKRKKYTRKR